MVIFMSSFQRNTLYKITTGYINPEWVYLILHMCDIVFVLIFPFREGTNHILLKTLLSLLFLYLWIVSGGVNAAL